MTGSDLFSDRQSRKTTWTAPEFGLKTRSCWDLGITITLKVYNPRTASFSKVNLLISSQSRCRLSWQPGSTQGSKNSWQSIWDICLSKHQTLDHWRWKTHYNFITNAFLGKGARKCIFGRSLSLPGTHGSYATLPAPRQAYHTACSFPFGNLCPDGGGYYWTTQTLKKILSFSLGSPVRLECRVSFEGDITVSNLDGTCFKNNFYNSVF